MQLTFQLGTVVYALWLTVYILLEREITRIFWRKSWRGSRFTAQLTQFFRASWRLVLYPVVFYGFVSAVKGGGNVRWIAAFTVVALTDHFVRSYFGWRRRDSVQGNAQRAAWKLLRINKQTFTRLIMFTPALAIVLLSGSRTSSNIFIINAFILGFIVFQLRKQKRAPVGMVEMEADVPLLDEIQAVGRRFGRSPKQVFVQMQKNPEMPIFPLYVIDQRPNFGATGLLVPVENLQCLNPAAFTAALALDWARQPYIKFNGRVVNPFTPWIIAGAMTAPMMVVILLIFLFPRKVSGFIPPFTFMVLPLVMLLVLMIMRLYFAMTTARANRDACAAWADADESQSRSGTAYLTGIAEQHAFSRGIKDSELVCHQLQLDAGLMRFTAENGITAEDMTRLCSFDTPSGSATQLPEVA